MKFLLSTKENTAELPGMPCAAYRDYTLSELYRRLGGFQSGYFDIGHQKSLKFDILNQ